MFKFISSSIYNLCILAVKYNLVSFIQVLQRSPKDADAIRKKKECEKIIMERQFCAAIEGEVVRPTYLSLKLDDIGIYDMCFVILFIKELVVSERFKFILRRGCQLRGTSF